MGDMGGSASHSNSHPSPAGIPPRRRNSSFLTADSFDRASFRSSTDSLLLPRVSRNTFTANEEIVDDGSSHLNSIPLVLALLPAVGGLIFTNGTAVLTDVTLLVLAAIFLNWSVRLPWDWYRSAQAVRVQDEKQEEALEADGYFPPPPAHAETIEEETSQDEEDDEGVASPPLPKKIASASQPAYKERARQHAAAAWELRLHELLALFACFGCPLLGAALLHHIRGSLSRPSEGLVSDYNLSIFVLGAEIRPLSHLLRLIQSRTLHLQRVVALNPYETASPNANRAAVVDLQNRVDELESHIASNAPNGTNLKGGIPPEKEKELAKSIETTLRAALQPELDAVTRATRRYEKRATLLGLQTESRLNALEARVQDAVTLAAGAERAQQMRSKGALGKMFDAGVMGTIAVGDAVAWVASVPIRVVEGVLGWVGWVLQSTVGRVVNVKILQFTNRKRKEAKKGERPGWKGKEQSADGAEWAAKRAERRAMRARKE